MSNRTEIPFLFTFNQGPFDGLTKYCKVLEFKLNTEWTMTFRRSEYSSYSIITILRQSAATMASVTVKLSNHDYLNTCPMHSLLFEPNCKSGSIHLRRCNHRNYDISGKVIILYKSDPPFWNNSLSSNLFQPLKELSLDFARLLDANAPFADVQLKCGTLTIPAHKNILSARSPVFRAMFSNEMTETRDNEVHIMDIDGPILQAMLTYVYTGQTGDLSYDLAGDLLFAADKYQLDGLKIVMIDYLKSNVSLENALQLLVLGDLHAQDLKDFAMDFIRDKCTKFSILEKTEEWKTLVKERPTLAIEVLTSLVKSKEKL